MHFYFFLPQSIGSALYLGPSVMDHSCQPNASVSFDGINLIVRTLVDKPEGNFNYGSDVFISYLDLLNDTGGRREKLQKQYYFRCGCVRCSDPGFERGMFCVQCTQCSREVFVGYGFDRCEKK